MVEGAIVAVSTTLEQAHEFAGLDVRDIEPPGSTSEFDVVEAE